MGFFGNPRNLVEAFGLTLFIFRLTGLFPFKYNAGQNKFVISGKLLIVTLAHVSVFTYVNVSAVMENWKNYAQPMLGHSSLASFGNLLLRLLDVLITFLILGPALIGSGYYVAALNLYMNVLDEFVLLGIDVTSIYRRMYNLSIISLIILASSISFCCWHSIFFYELITQRPPELKFYLVATLSDLYKNLFMFYGNSQFFALFMITSQLNCFLSNFLKEYKEIYETKRILKYEKLKN